MINKKFSFHDEILAWYDQYGRKALPWKHKGIAQKHRPYHIWLSEVMLQQTQVATVIPYYQRFIKNFPSLESLANASQDDVLKLWAGLGYYARGRNLHKAAQSMWSDYQAVPNNFDLLLSQPGIGRSTAGAIMAQAFNEPYPILDGNVKRVLARFHVIDGWPGRSAVAKELWKYAEKYTSTVRVADYTQAIMDLGALVCTRSKPKCDDCPLIKKCSAYKVNTQALYPASKPKKEKPVKSVHILCLVRDEKSILIERRPPAGIWGGLWSFPEFQSLELLDEHLDKEYGLNETYLDSLDSFRHTFSHYHLDIHPHILTLSNKIGSLKIAESERFYDFAKPLGVGLPAPMQALFQRLRLNYV